MICDSVAKYVSVDGVEVKAYKGHTILQIADRLKFSTIMFCEYSTFLLHVGTNDIANLASNTTFFDLMDRYKLLVDFIKFKCPRAKVLILGLIPRPKDFGSTQPLLWGVNNALQSWCCLYQYLIFVPAHKAFLQNSLPRLNFFSASDLLHLNGLGVYCMERVVRQAVSAKNISARSHWKKRPLVAYQSTSVHHFWMCYKGL